MSISLEEAPQEKGYLKANKLMKRCSPSLVIRKMNTKTTTEIPLHTQQNGRSAKDARENVNKPNHPALPSANGRNP